MRGDLIGHRDDEFPMRFLVISCNYIQFISSKQASAGITKNVHLEPRFVRVINISPPVCFAGIEEKLPLTTFTGSLVRFDSFRNAHTIQLSSSMSLYADYKKLGRSQKLHSS